MNEPRKTTDHFTHETIEKMQDTWVDALKGNVAKLAKPFTALHAHQCGEIIEEIKSDEKAQKVLSKRKGGGVLERRRLQDLKECLDEIESELLSEATEEEIEDTINFYKSSINRWLVFEYELGCKYSTRMLSSLNYLSRLLQEVLEDKVDSELVSKYNDKNFDTLDVCFPKLQMRQGQAEIFESINAEITARIRQEMADIEKEREEVQAEIDLENESENQREVSITEIADWIDSVCAVNNSWMEDVICAKTFITLKGDWESVVSWIPQMVVEHYWDKEKVEVEREQAEAGVAECIKRGARSLDELDIRFGGWSRSGIDSKEFIELVMERVEESDKFKMEVLNYIVDNDYWETGACNLDDPEVFVPFLRWGIEQAEKEETEANRDYYRDRFSSLMYELIQENEDEFSPELVKEAEDYFQAFAEKVEAEKREVYAGEVVSGWTREQWQEHLESLTTDKTCENRGGDTNVVKPYITWKFDKYSSSEKNSFVFYLMGRMASETSPVAKRMLAATAGKELFDIFEGIHGNGKWKYTPRPKAVLPQEAPAPDPVTEEELDAVTKLMDKKMNSGAWNDQLLYVAEVYLDNEDWQREMRAFQELLFDGVLKEERISPVMEVWLKANASEYLKKYG